MKLVQSKPIATQCFEGLVHQGAGVPSDGIARTHELADHDALAGLPREVSHPDIRPEDFYGCDVVGIDVGYQHGFENLDRHASLLFAGGSWCHKLAAINNLRSSNTTHAVYNHGTPRKWGVGKFGPCLALPMRQSCRLAPASSVRTSSLSCMTRLSADACKRLHARIQREQLGRGEFQNVGKTIRRKYA